MANELSKVGKVWSKGEPVVNSGNFYLSPLIRPYIIETAYGKDLVGNYQDNNHYAEDIFIEKYLKDKKVEAVLSLCCGFGSVERRFVSKIQGIKLCIGLDIASPTSPRHSMISRWFKSCMALSTVNDSFMREPFGLLKKALT